MFRIISIILISTLAAFGVKYAGAQNLVTNGGFENYSFCPTALEQLDNAVGWNNPSTANPEMFHGCAGASCGQCVPTNYGGNQTPHCGQGYIGFFPYHPPIDYRGYAQNQLQSPLVGGTTYEVSFYVNLADNFQTAIEEIGAYFSPTQVSQSNYYVMSQFTPQVINQPGNMLNDKNNWMLITGTFVATGGEQYMVIGSFTPDASTTTQSGLGGSDARSYYYVDDVCVAELGTGCITQDSIAATICTGDSIFAGGQYQTTSGVFYDSLITASCFDSVIVTSLTVVGPSFNILDNDTTLCAGQTLLLDATVNNGTYIWQDNSTNATFNVTSSGTYSVEVTLGGCISYDTINVTYVPPLNLNLGNDTVMCIGEVLPLDATFANATYLWQDNSTNATFNVSQAGTYWVQISVNGCTAIDSIDVTFNPSPNSDLGNDTTLCSGETLLLDPIGSNANYLWQDASTGPDFLVDQQGTYWVEVTANGCTSIDTIEVFYITVQSVVLGNDTNLCTGETMVLDATVPNATYLWQDNSTNPTFNVVQQGTYSVEITINGCSTTDTINITYGTYPVVDLGNDTTLCQGTLLTLDATTSNASYLWQDNSSNATFDVIQQGIHWVNVTTNGCTTTDYIDIVIENCNDTILLIMPNVFTPNNDGIDDLFTPVTVIGIESIKTAIYNRWGKLLYSTDHLNIEWNGGDAPDGVYYWHLDYVDQDGEQGTQNGFVHLFR
jgi:gliding motility-associated-like protein